MLELFLASLHKQGYAQNTLRSYYNILNIFQDRNLKEIKLKDLETLLSDNANTAVTQQAAFRKYFGWLHEQGYININPADGLGIPHPKHKRTPIPLKDKKLIMDTINALPLMPRAFFLLLEKMDLSPSELLALNADSPLPETPYVQELCSKQKKGPLFITAKNQRATYDWAYYWWRKVLKDSGVRRYAMYQLKY